MNTSDVLKYGHLTVLQAVDGLAETDWTTAGVCGVWSVKEIVAHLASFEQMLVDLLRSLLGSSDTPTLDRFRQAGVAFNDDEVARRGDRTAGQVLDEYNRAYEEAAGLLPQVPLEVRRRNGVLPWYGPEYDLEDFIVYTFYGHKREHCAQIAVYRDRLT